MSANVEERAIFIELDKKHKYREKIIKKLHDLSKKINIFKNITICEGGSVGIAVYPKEYDKIQILQHIQSNYQYIHYFGDKFDANGNDYNLLNSDRVIGHPVENVMDTYRILEGLLY